MIVLQFVPWIEITKQYGAGVCLGQRGGESEGGGFPDGSVLVGFQQGYLMGDGIERLTHVKRWLVITSTLGDSRFLNAAVSSVSVLGGEVCHRIISPELRRKEIMQIAPHADWMEDEGKGLYHALALVSHDTADYVGVTWLNDDDLLDRNGARAAWRILENDVDRSTIAYGLVDLIDAYDHGQGWLSVCRKGRDMPALLSRGVVPLAQPGTWIYGALWSRLDGVRPDFRLAGDLDFFVRASQDAGEFEYVLQRMARFRLRAGQLSKDVANVREEKDRALKGLSPRLALAARIRCGMGNPGVYIDRLRRHGQISMERLYQRGGPPK
ncbi:MAG: hypothetical protein J6386_15695 [Candidatus Synoicihabitans palmerolidicus]|nr:hypothetical protein [Candidatus Synoicihabitans palmerolidicus]